jgi:PKD domain
MEWPRDVLKKGYRKTAWFQPMKWTRDMLSKKCRKTARFQPMKWTRDMFNKKYRKTAWFRPMTLDALETRSLLSLGITPLAGAPIHAVAGVAITDAILATYTVTSSSGEPGTQWRAQIDFGDGQVDKQIVPVEVGNVFEIVDSHTYSAAGNYTITVMIAAPQSKQPNSNVETVPVTVTTPSAIGSFTSSGLGIKPKAGKTFHGNIARFSDPHTKASQFQAIINWGDGSTSTTGQIHTQGKGRFVVSGSHRYTTLGSFGITVTIQNVLGQEIAAESTADVIKK